MTIVVTRFGGLVLVGLSCLALGASCGGKAHGPSAGDQSAAGAPGMPAAERRCQGTLEVEGREARELDCETGVEAIGGGLFRLVLATPEGDSVVITLPSLEVNSYGSLDCVDASILLADEGRDYLGDQLTFPDAVVSTRVLRAGDQIGLEIGGVFCDFVANDGSGAPGTVCATASLKGVRAPLALAELACDCPAAQRTEKSCEIQSCASGACHAERCPIEAALCQAP